MSVTIENLVTSGTFSLDGGTWDVDNNVWIVGNDDECVIIDSPHDAAAIISQVRGRKVLAILLTHAHNDHIGAAREVAAAVEAPIYLHPDDLVLWEQVYPGRQTGPRPRRRRRVPGGRRDPARHPYPRPLAGLHLLPPRRRRDGLHRGHPLQRRPGRHRQVLQRLPHHPRLHPRTAADASCETVVRTGHGDNTTIGAERETLSVFVSPGGNRFRWSPTPHREPHRPRFPRSGAVSVFRLQGGRTGWSGQNPLDCPGRKSSRRRAKAVGTPARPPVGRLSGSGPASRAPTKAELITRHLGSKQERRPKNATRPRIPGCGWRFRSVVPRNGA